MNRLKEKLKKMLLTALIAGLVVNGVPGTVYGAEVTPEAETAGEAVEPGALEEAAKMPAQAEEEERG